MPTHPIRVLFLCTQNSARSQIAEALLTKKGGDRFIVASAGTEPADAVHPGAVTALRVAGIDWTGRRPKPLDRIMDESWDIVITLCDRARESCPALPSRPVTAHWGIPDPSITAASGRGMSAFDDALTLLSRRLDLMLSVRPELLDRLVLQERLRAIGRQSLEPDAHATTSGDDVEASPRDDDGDGVRVP